MRVKIWLSWCIAEGRRKKEEGRRKKEEGRKAMVSAIKNFLIVLTISISSNKAEIPIISSN
ncbi:MAG: hypothetical protein EAZ60_10000 [Oscillatoriales cyanobacterium]|uniref:hypothetical protein n=1 Tax=unclassified Microcoleus TaxID=2642155 RepID=UPI001D7D133E|nr:MULTISPECIES: hypothetical protein [unclassified Microcoleus]MCC3460588.1 hypothetical protein [Microcoleus sp. PH2017_11_PCY_U_A]TAE96181.1 MAG: hypothetical protein EAZ79_15580 [Oscillatoriales cyanobacterium]MCC3528915.1 hypothetical protein [Microcoleus sp. PH2017_21_RUC_O_A]MCC3541088.1 hypothetical protein [Microcoleus sp. PH2017_22_RUC_O_B]MCC3559976.1 hypothetical protein [Microcoleus sp. PH2017_27_LUM_O_A]